MSGSALLKKALPVLLVFVIIITIAGVVTGIKASEKDVPQINDSEKIYLSIEEDGLTYEISRGEMYENLKSTMGTSALINTVNKMILSVEKNSEGVSFYEGVSLDKIHEEIDEAVYGEDGKEKLTDEEIAEKEEDFLKSMYSSYGYRAEEIYGTEIENHYRLVLAKEDYAKAQLEKAIETQNSKAEKDDDEDPYFTDDDIDDYHSDNYYKKYWGIIVPFVTKEEAENALQQLGVGIDTAKDVWVHLEVIEEKDDNQNGTGVFKTKYGDPLTSAEVVETFIKLYNLVYGYKSENGAVLTEGTDYKVVDVKAEVDALKNLASELTTKYEADEDVAATVTSIKDAIAALETVLAANKYSTANLTAAIEKFVAANDKVAENTDEDQAEKLKESAKEDAVAFKALVEGLNDKGYIFDTTLEESPLFYDNEKLSGYNSTLPNKFNNTYTIYQPFATDSKAGSTNVKPSWYTDELLGLSSNSYYVFALKLDEIAIPTIEDVKDEIIEKLKEAELTSNYIETKMAQLRENYSLVIYDEDLEAEYTTSMESYDVEHESTKEESSENVAQFTQFTYTKADVSSKKEFKSVRKQNDGIYVYNNGVYEEVKKYNENETYYTRKAGEVVTLTAEDFFKEMDKSYGMSLALSELSYQRFLYNKALNVYKDMNTGEWLGEDGEAKRDQFIEDIETQRLNFLAGGYTSYGYDPANMSWNEFMKALYGAENENELADSFLYNDILADFTATLNYIVEVDDEGNYVNTNYKELVESDLWKLYQEKMEEVLADYFSVSGIHFLVSRYEDPANSVSSSASPLDPKEWTDTQKELAKELIKDVISYLEVSKADYKTTLTEIVTAFKESPLYVDGKAPVIYDEEGNEVKYTLTKAEVTIDVAKYKTAGLYVKYEDLSTFTNGQMVETFNDAVKAIWDKDIADEVYDRVTVLQDPIETEFGYHLYINLASNEVVKYDSYEIKVNEDGTWEYVYEDEEKTEHKTVEAVFPQLYEVLLYCDEETKAELTSGASKAVETYYSAIAGEIASQYFTYVCQYTDILSLLTDASCQSTNYTKADLEKIIDINIEAWFENNLEYLTNDDTAIIRKDK